MQPPVSRGQSSLQGVLDQLVAREPDRKDILSIWVGELWELNLA